MDTEVSTPISIQDLPIDPLLQIFSYLDYKDIVRCRRVCQRFDSISKHGPYWKIMCKKYWLLESCASSTSWYSLFVEYYNDYGKYIDIYDTIKKAWIVIENYTKEHFPHIYDSLNNGLSEAELDAHENNMKDKSKLSDIKFPADMRCAYRIHNGQHLHRTCCGLFGTMEIHGHIRCEYMLDIESVVDIYMRENAEFGFLNEIFPLTRCSNTGVSQYIGLSQSQHHKYGWIFYSSPVWDQVTSELGTLKTDSFITGSSFSEWFVTYAEMLCKGRFLKLRNQIYRFLHDPPCTATTGAITVKVSTSFMAELSRLYPPRFFHAYRITMSMDKNASMDQSCRLHSRHWIITDADDNVEHVNGLGVVGEFPVMKPGAEYSWISCTSFPTMYGHMKGHFTFTNLTTGEVKEVKCPVYHLHSLPIFEDDELKNESNIE